MKILSYQNQIVNLDW